MRAGIASAAVAAALVLLLTGCGGGKPSATEQWQDSVCSALDDWAGQINGYVDDIRTQLRSPGVGTVDEIRATVEKGETATDELRKQLLALDAPPVSDGQSAKKLVDDLAVDLQQTSTRVRQQLGTVGSAASVTEVVQTISAIADEISLALSRTKTTFQSLQQLNAELADGFQTVGSCKDLRSRFE